MIELGQLEAIRDFDSFSEMGEWLFHNVDELITTIKMNEFYQLYCKFAVGNPKAKLTIWDDESGAIIDVRNDQWLIEWNDIDEAIVQLKNATKEV